jgi:toxin ParE1/3/4
MPNVLFVSMAEASLLEAWAHVAANNASAADRLVDAIHASCERLASFPEMGQTRSDLGPRIRQFTVRDYVLIYRPCDGGIEVLLVAHGARDVDRAFRTLILGQPG